MLQVKKNSINFGMVKKMTIILVQILKFAFLLT